MRLEHESPASLHVILGAIKSKLAVRLIVTTIAADYVSLFQHS